MVAAFSSSDEMFTRTPGAVSLVLLLKRGLDSIQQGLYAEGAAFLTLVREQLAPDQIHLADVLDTFLQGHAEYRRLQEALYEASTRFAEARSQQEVRVATLCRALSLFIHSEALQQHVPSLSPDPTTAPRAGTRPAPTFYRHMLPPRNMHDVPVAPALQGDNGESKGEAEHNGEAGPRHYISVRNQPDVISSLPELAITCFGHFEVRRQERPVVLCSSRSGQAILRYLVARSGHAATSDTLQALFWPDDEPAVAQRKLHIAISALRRSLHDDLSSEGQGQATAPRCGSYLLYKHGTYSLNPVVAIRTDVDEFLCCYQAGQQGGVEKVSLYEKACLLYKGPFLVEDIYADWSFLQREQLSKVHVAMCRVLTDFYLKIHRYEDAAKWASAILQENRCDEAAHRQLIQVYAAQGRRSEALQQYHRCERILREELGVQPLPETRLLFSALLANEPLP